MAEKFGSYTISIGCKIKHPARNTVKQYIACLILKPVVFICKHFLNVEFEIYIIKKGQM